MYDKWYRMGLSILILCTVFYKEMIFKQHAIKSLGLYSMFYDHQDVVFEGCFPLKEVKQLTRLYNKAIVHTRRP